MSACCCRDEEKSSWFGSCKQLLCWSQAWPLAAVDVVWRNNQPTHASHLVKEAKILYHLNLAPNNACIASFSFYTENINVQSVKKQYEIEENILGHFVACNAGAVWCLKCEVEV